MQARREKSAPDLVIGVGSPHGDDELGWAAADVLTGELDPAVRVRKVTSPLDLVEQLRGCGRLVLIDACRTGAEAGTIIRLEWPDERIASARPQSSHGFGLPAALELASRLGRLPRRVIVFGVEIGDVSPVAELEREVETTVPELCRLIREELARSEPEPTRGDRPEG